MVTGRKRKQNIPKLRKKQINMPAQNDKTKSRSTQKRIRAKIKAKKLRNQTSKKIKRQKVKIYRHEICKNEGKIK